VPRRHLESTVTIRRPVEDVWAFMTDLFNAPRMRATTLATRKVSPGPVGPGTVADNRTVILGFETHVRFTVIEWDPPHALGISLSGPLIRSARGRVELRATSDGTRQITTFDLEPSLAGVLLWPLVGPLARRNLARSDRKQKALLEASSSDTPAP
jgi:uncharacterized protein YndB with AHSA1/START domain